MKKYLIIILLFASCNPVKKALKVAHDNPKEFAAFCAEAFPVTEKVTVKDSIRFDTMYLQSDPVTVYETINDTVYKTVSMPGTTYFVTKTVTKDSTIIRVDNAALQAKQKQNDDLIVVNKKLVTDKAKADWWKRACLITWGILAAFIIGWIIAKIYGKK